VKSLVDVELIKAVQNRDKQAFRTLFSLYKQKVYGTAYLILKDYQLAEDIVQETFLQVFLKLTKLKEPLYFERWLYKITVNLCLDSVRKQKRHPVSSLEEYMEIQTDFSLKTMSTPETEAIYRDMQKKILQCIYSLSAKYATVLVLHYYNNFTIKEIAQITNSSETAVKTRLFRARKTLEKELDKKQLEIMNKPTGGDYLEYR